MTEKERTNSAIIAGIVLLLIIIFAGYLIYRNSNKTNQNVGEVNNTVGDINWEETRVFEKENNRTIVSINDFPNQVMLSNNSSFGRPEIIKEVVKSPDSKWLAMSLGGASHGFGYLYQMETKKLSVVVFQFEGDVGKPAWSENSRFVAFPTVSPKTQKDIKLIDVENLQTYPDTTGEYVEAIMQNKLNMQIDRDIEMVEWRKQNICVSMSQIEYCIDPNSKTIVNQLTKEMESWKRYSNEKFSILSLYYPPEMKVGEQDPNSVGFSFAGPTQVPETELFDGIGLNIRKDQLSGSLTDYIANDMKQTGNVGQVTKPLTTSTIDGIESSTYSAQTLGTITKHFVPINENEVFVISYFSPDPGNRGYQEIVDKVIGSIEIDKK